jgi:hypothetical protein
MSGDLTRADAERAVDEATRAVAALGHLAMAGVLHFEGEDVDVLRSGLSTAVAALTAAAGLVSYLGEMARRLPEGEP